VVLVATVRALKHHGGADKKTLAQENLPALIAGLPNLQRHINNITQVFGLPCVVAVNRFPTDTQAELDAVRDAAVQAGVRCEISQVHAQGGAGGIDLAHAVLEAMDEPSNFAFAYESGMKLKAKIEAVATKIYRAEGVTFAPAAAKSLRELEKLGYGKLPVCIAKTQYSFSDDATKLAAPDNFTITVRQVRLSAGAGFAVAITGDIMTMPGLPKIPAAHAIDIDEAGNISGLF
jgi:formate--tetrahydrofolate ligase